MPPPAYVAYRAGSAVARALPARSVPTVSRLVGRVVADRLGDRRLILQRNLDRAHGRRLEGSERTEAVRAAVASYAHYWIESFRLPGTSVEELDRRTIEVGYEKVAEAAAEGKGVILALPHLGAWEWAAFWFTAVKGHEVTAVAEQIEPPELAEWFVGLRKRLGIEIVPFGPDAATACVRALKAGRVLALPSDRDLAGTGVPVTFFGEETTLPGGPATLALRTGAPLLPVACYFDTDHRHLGVALDRIDTERRGRLRDDVARVTQDLAHDFEELIRRAPEQWHLMQPNWPSDHAALASTDGRGRAVDGPPG